MKKNQKRIIYIALVIVFIELVFLILGGLIEMKFMNFMLSRGLPIQGSYIFGYVYTALPAQIVWAFFVSGLILGHLLGKKWWEVVYVKNRRMF